MSDDRTVIEYGPREPGTWRGWYRNVTVTRPDGAVEQYRVGVDTDGRPRKIAYRGGQRGYWWFGVVYSREKQSRWDGRVSKSTGVLGLLKKAGVIGDEPTRQKYRRKNIEGNQP